MPPPTAPFHSPPPIGTPLEGDETAALRAACGEFFAASTNQQSVWTFPRDLDALLLENEPAVRQVAWEAYRCAPVHNVLKTDFDAGKVRSSEHTSPYTMRTVGKRPANGWPLFIAMHGGGGPQRSSTTASGGAWEATTVTIRKWGLPDHDKIAEMYPNVRNPVPRDVTWRLSDAIVHDFFWLHAPALEPGKNFNVTCKENRVVVTTDLGTVSILLDSRLIDFEKPVVLDLNGKTSTHALVPSLRTLCATMQRRGDPELAFTVELRWPVRYK